MLRRLLSLSRYFVVLAVGGILIASVALLIYEGLVVITAVMAHITDGGLSSKTAKILAVGLIEAVDIFLIAIVCHMIGLGLYNDLPGRQGARTRAVRTPPGCSVNKDDATCGSG